MIVDRYSDRVTVTYEGYDLIVRLDGEPHRSFHVISDYWAASNARECAEKLAAEASNE